MCAAKSFQLRNYCFISTIYHNAAVTVNSLAANEGTICRSQKDHACRYLGRLSGPPHWARKIFDSLLAHRCRDERGPNWTRCDSIHANTFSNQLIAQPACEGDDGTLCRCVVQKVWTADVRVDTSVVDNACSSLQVWKRIFGDVKDRMDVGVEGVNPLVTGRQLDIFLYLIGVTSSSHSGRSLIDSTII